MHLQLSVPSPDEIYAASLQTLYLGRPMWYPEPHATGEPHIGDVGFIKDGAFVRLFNIHESQPHTFWPVPFENRDPFPRDALRVDPRSRPLAPQAYCSHGVESRGLSAGTDITAGAAAAAGFSAAYRCHAAAGAVLELRSEAHAEELFDNEALKRYILRHHDEWHAYVRGGLGHALRQTDLVVVRGWVKTAPDWAVAAFSRTGRGHRLAAKAEVPGAAGAHFSLAAASATAGPVAQRRGEQFARGPRGDRGPRRPHEDPPSRVGPPEPTLRRDQCVFLRRYKLRKRFWSPRKVVAGAGYHRLPDGRDSSGGPAVEGAASEEEEQEQDVGCMWHHAADGGIPDPTEVLLDYMLEVTAAEVVLASDEDVATIISGKSIVDFASYLRWLQPPVRLDGKIGLLDTEDIVRHRQERNLARSRISYADWVKWPGISPDRSGRMVDLEVYNDETYDKPTWIHTLLLSPTGADQTWCRSDAHSADGKLVAAAFEEAGVLVWRVSDGMLLQRLHNGARGDARALAFSPRGTALLCGYTSGAAAVWDVASGQERLRVAAGAEVTAVAYAPEGRLLATGCLDGSAQVWDARTGARQHAFGALSRDEVDTLSFVQRERSSTLVVEHTNAAGICDLQSGAQHALVDSSNILDSVLSPHGDRVVVGFKETRWPEVWSTEDHTRTLVLEAEQTLTRPVGFSPDGKEVFAACPGDKAVRVFDASTGAALRQYQLRESTPWTCVYSPDGEYVAVSGEEGEVLLFDRKSGHHPHYAARFAARDAAPVLRFLPDNRTLLVRNNVASIQLIDVHAALQV